MLADDGTTVVALGVGEAGSVDADALRRAGAALARNAGSASKVATTLTAAADDPGLAAAVVEGIGLAPTATLRLRSGSKARGASST